MKTDLYVIEYRKILKKSYVLEGSCDTCLVDLYRALAGDVFTVKLYDTFIGFVNSGKQIERRGLACAVRTDEAVEFAFIDGDVKIVDGS